MISTSSFKNSKNSPFAFAAAALLNWDQLNFPGISTVRSALALTHRFQVFSLDEMLSMTIISNSDQEVRARRLSMQGRMRPRAAQVGMIIETNPRRATFNFVR